MSEPTFQLLEKLEKLPYFSQLLATGIIPVNWITYKQVFEFYNNEVKRLTLNKTLSSGELGEIRRTSITTTAEEFRIGESSVYRIIQKMA